MACCRMALASEHSTRKVLSPDMMRSCAPAHVVMLTTWQHWACAGWYERFGPRLRLHAVRSTWQAAFGSQGQTGLHLDG